MDRSNIEKIARNPEDRVLLAKVWDKIQAGVRKNIPAKGEARFIFAAKKKNHLLKPAV